MEKIVIIGSGPAGLTAAIYSARAALKPVVVQGLQPGGQLTTTTVIENWPGFREGIDGNKLMQEMRAQAEHVGTRFENGLVEKIEKKAGVFHIQTDSKVILSQAVIVATGASALTLPLPNLSKLMGYGISTCAVCDGFFYRNKVVAVVGGGDSAMEEAMYLSKLASSVYLIHRRDTFKASKSMQERVFANPKIQIIYNTGVVDTLSDTTGLTGIVTESSSGQRKEMDIDGLFMAIGHKPNTEFLRDFAPLDEAGYMKTTVGTRTAVVGLFAAGDVEDKIYRQAITASGRGCQAALEAEKFVEGHHS